MGLVFSGGGARAAYQVGVLKALLPYIKDKDNAFRVIIGSSIGAINGLVFGACLRHGLSHTVDTLESLWAERTFGNSFRGSASMAFLRAINVAARQYLSPGPKADGRSVFDPTPLMKRVDEVILANGGLTPEARSAHLQCVAVMTTMEGQRRKPLVFLSTHKRLEAEVLKGASFEVCYVETLSAKHGFASAALPSILPAVELDTEQGKVRLVDGGISQNVPVDPAVRMGAHRVLVVDVSGRNWWLARYGEAEDTRPSWEVPADESTFCLRPPDTLVFRCQLPLGPILKATVGSSTKRFIRSVGALWPVFTVAKNKLGEDAAYEIMTYAALEPEYQVALIERGYEETLKTLQSKRGLEFTADPTLAQTVSP